MGAIFFRGYPEKFLKKLHAPRPDFLLKCFLPRFFFHLRFPSVDVVVIIHVLGHRCREPTRIETESLQEYLLSSCGFRSLAPIRLSDVCFPMSPTPVESPKNTWRVIQSYVLFQFCVMIFFSIFIHVHCILF